MNVQTIAPPRSTLFSAALQLINAEPDHLARLCLLRDAFPRASLAEIQRTLIETAVHLHVFTETQAQRAEALEVGA